MFEDEESEPILHTFLEPQGYVGNRPKCCYDEDDTWAIDQFDEDGEIIYNTFLYTSENEYEQDCKLLNLK